jgi:hypothetical protein
MPVYETTFDVDASAERVWAVLYELDRYDEWNPQMKNAKGALEPGAQIGFKLVLPGRPAMNLTATVEEVEPTALLSWRGHLGASWFFEGLRRFAIRPTGAGRVSVTHVEDVHGFFAPVFGVLMGSAVQKSHDALNEALRARAEATQ